MNRETALQLLQPFIGVWKTSGTVLSGEDKTPLEITGTDIYEWLPGDFFLLHKVDVLMGKEQNDAIEIIGYDEQRQLFTMSAIDNKGATTEMVAECNNGIWVFSNSQLTFEGGFNTDGTQLSGNWKRKDSDGNWTQFIQISLTKQE